MTPDEITLVNWIFSQRKKTGRAVLTLPVPRIFESKSINQSIIRLFSAIISLGIKCKDGVLLFQNEDARRIPASVRRDVLIVGECKRCGATDDLQIDHIVPVFLGGSNRKENLQCLCGACNREKGAALEK